MADTDAAKAEKIAAAKKRVSGVIAVHNPITQIYRVEIHRLIPTITHFLCPPPLSGLEGIIHHQLKLTFPVPRGGGVTRILVRATQEAEGEKEELDSSNIHSGRSE